MCLKGIIRYLLKSNFYQINLCHESDGDLVVYDVHCLTMLMNENFMRWISFRSFIFLRYNEAKSTCSFCRGKQTKCRHVKNISRVSAAFLLSVLSSAFRHLFLFSLFFQISCQSFFLLFETGPPQPPGTCTYGINLKSMSLHSRVIVSTNLGVRVARSHSRVTTTPRRPFTDEG